MRIVFIGTGAIGVPTLRALQESKHELVGIVTQPDKPVGREQKLTAPPIKAAIAEAGPVVLQPPKIRDKESTEEIRALSPDTIVVMSYGQILPRAVLEIPKVACINLHVSLLPRWRGAAPIQAAIAAGDRETGITVMFMDEGLDTGDILLQQKIPISPDETGESLHDRLAEIAPGALLEALRLLDGGNVSRIRQNDELATIAPKLNRENGRLNWNEKAETLERKIRAFNPWPTAFIEIAGKTLKIYSAEIIDRRGQPGEILEKEKRLVISAADRALSLGEVQLQGRRRMSAQEFLKGYRP